MPATLIVFALCHAIDGDTLRCGSERVRLARIDAPEARALGGSQSTDFMRVLVDGNRVLCVISGREKYGRMLGDCFISPGQSLSDQSLEAGMSEPYRGRR